MLVGPHVEQNTYRMLAYIDYTLYIVHTISQSEFFFIELFDWLLSVNPFFAETILF